MSEIISAVIGAVIGVLGAGWIGVWLANWQRKRIAKDQFLAFISHQEAVLERTPTDGWKSYFLESIIPIHDAMYAVKPFVSNSEFLCLRAAWEDYKTYANGEQNWQSQSVNDTVAQTLGAKTGVRDKSADQWISECLKNFRDVIG